ncbi:hypothetical protein HWV62_13567 [Athelia sp. TMB]|nr:hypothetical protein HWV62_13567 [Athelia sp. TMB]
MYHRARLASLPRAPESRYELVANTRATASSLRASDSLSKLNFLVVLAGLMTLKGRNETAKGRNETAKGLHRKMALEYYARWEFMRELMLLLRNAKGVGEDAKFLSVLATGQGGPIDFNNLDIKEGYPLPRVMEVGLTSNDIMIKVRILSTPLILMDSVLIMMPTQSFAEQQPNTAFTHTFPGLVCTTLIKPAHQALALV